MWTRFTQLQTCLHKSVLRADRIVGNSVAVVQSPSWCPPSLCPHRERPTDIKTAPSSSAGESMSASLAGFLPRGVAGWHSGERGASSSKEPQIPDQRSGGSDSEQRGWVRCHVLNWHSTVSMSRMVSVCTITCTIMVRMSYLLLVCSAVGMWLCLNLCGPFMEKLFYHLHWDTETDWFFFFKCFLMARNSSHLINKVLSSASHCWRPLLTSVSGVGSDYSLWLSSFLIHFG